ncbi:protein disulfide-isomerase, partial [Clonorchis sinensis]
MSTFGNVKKTGAQDAETMKAAEGTLAIQFTSRPGSCKSLCASSRKSSVALKALRIAQLQEYRVKREVELQRTLVEAQSKTELAKIELEAEEDSPDEACEPVASTDRLEQYVKSCQLDERPLRYAGATRQSSPAPKPAVSITPVTATVELPKVELSYFDGNPSHYWRFTRQFEIYIESKVQDAGQRLLYLIHYCQGDAKAAIEECVMLSPEVAYSRAREILRNLFGQPPIVARCLLECLFRFARQTTGTAKSLSDLCIKMRSCEIALTQMRYVSDLHSFAVVERIVRCLPSPLQHKWAEVADTISMSGR